MKRFFSVFVSISLLLSLLAVFSSCGKKDSTCTVTFDYNYNISFSEGQPARGRQGYGKNKETKTVYKGDFLSSPPVLPSTGTLSALTVSYIFGGWYKEPACENAFDFNSEPINTDITLYAKWIQIPSAFNPS